MTGLTLDNIDTLETYAINAIALAKDIQAKNPRDFGAALRVQFFTGTRDMCRELRAIKFPPACPDHDDTVEVVAHPAGYNYLMVPTEEKECDYVTTQIAEELI
jgi:hypothetical protein